MDNLLTCLLRCPPFNRAPDWRLQDDVSKHGLEAAGCWEGTMLAPHKYLLLCPDPVSTASMLDTKLQAITLRDGPLLSLDQQLRGGAQMMCLVYPIPSTHVPTHL